MELFIIKTFTKKVPVKYLRVCANVRHWEDATVNGVEDKDGSLIPFRKNNIWCPVIDLETGIVVDWPAGTRASVHYKVCDSGSYYLLDDEMQVVSSIEEDYVPAILSPGDNGYGDYIILNINENRKIEDWEADLSEFQERENIE